MPAFRAERYSASGRRPLSRTLTDPRRRQPARSHAAQARNTDFAIYDYGYLHSLQNRKPALYNGATFTLKEIRQKPLRLRASIGSYFDMLATCAALERELRHAAGKGWLRAPSRLAYHRQVPPPEALRYGRSRSAAIGIGTLTVFNDGGDLPGDSGAPF